MNGLALLIGLGPLIGWGFFPTVASKIGGKPANQIFGTAMGTMIFAFIFMVFTGTKFPTGNELFLTVLSGIGWASAQIITFKSFQMIGSSKAMPITTAFQLIGASVWGVIMLGNWDGRNAMIVGFVSLAVIILGAYLTVWSENKSSSNTSALQKSVGMLAIGEIGYLLYSAAPKFSDKVSGKEAFLPQALGMVIVAVVYGLVLLSSGKGNIFKEKISWQHILSGFFFAFAALTLLISTQSDMNGLATGFVLSQTSVILATLTGIFILKQKKTKNEMIITIIGLVLILLAATATVLIDALHI